MAFPIDHLLTVTTERETARAALVDMGFELTARGEHPGRGTSNHLMFFGRSYWELLSVDEPGPANSMLLGKASTLAGCALRTENVALDAAAAGRLGAQPGRVEEITRPVRVDGEWQTARFAIASVTPQAATDTHFFFCQHLTPQWVWPREAVKHPNGACRLRALHVVAPTRESAEEGFGPLLGSGGSGEPEIEYLSLDDYRGRFDTAPPLPSDGRVRFGGITLQVQDLNQCATYLTAKRVPHRRLPNSISVFSKIIGHPIVFAP
jgi:hypothetical protein